MASTIGEHLHVVVKTRRGPAERDAVEGEASAPEQAASHGRRKPKPTAHGRSREAIGYVHILEMNGQSFRLNHSRVRNKGSRSPSDLAHGIG